MRTNYSHSKCPSCTSTSFEMVEDVPKLSNYKIMFVRCSSCKTVVGLTDYFNSGDLIHKLAKALKIDL